MAEALVDSRTFSKYTGPRRVDLSLRAVEPLDAKGAPIMKANVISGVAQVILAAVSAAAASGLWQPDTQLLALVLAVQAALGGATSMNSKPVNGH